MKSIMRFALVMLMALVLVACGSEEGAKSTEQGDVITLKFGHHDAEVSYTQNPYHAYADTFKKLVEERTDGKVKVDLYPNSQLGDLRSMVEQAARGELDIVGGADVGLLSSYTKAVDILSVPYAFNSHHEVVELLNGELGDELTEEIVDKSNLHVLSYLPTALRHFSNSKHEIRTPDDMKGMKIRTQEIPVHQAMVRSLGANPTAIPFEEVYSALQTGVADGQENAPYTMINSNLHEVQDYYTMDGHLVNTATIMMNHDVLNSLDSELQEIIMDAALEAQTTMIDILDKRTEEDLETFKERDIQITELTKEEREKFKNLSMPAVLELLEKEVDQKWIDLLLSKIDMN